MEKKARRITAGMLVVALSVVLLAGCSTDNKNKAAETSSATSSATDSKSTDSGAIASPEGFTYTGSGPITDKPASLSILATNAWSNNVDLNKAEIVKAVVDKAGVTVNWELLVPGTYQEAISPRLAAGSDLPDIIYNLEQDQLMKNIKGGLFKPIDQYIEKYGVNIKKLYEKYPELKASLTTPDGEMYYIPQLTATKNYMPLFMVNLRWLDKLGLKEPTTLDEFTNMLRAFKTDDPNGNGKQDEIPFTMDQKFLNLAFGPIFGLDLNNNFYADKDSKVHFSYYDSAYKDYLTYMNGIYQEGLLESDFASTTADQVTSKFSQDIAGSSFNFSWYTSMVYSPLYKDYDVNKPIIQGILPLKGPHEEPFYFGRNAITGIFGITKDAKDPELAFKFLDYASSDEAKVFYTWGIEDVTYETVDGKKKFTDKGKDNAFVQPYGINPVNLPIEQSVDSANEMVAPWHYQRDLEIEPYIRDPFPFVYALPEEASVESTAMPDITTYVKEMQIKFITGKESLDGFDKYIKTLKGMNVEEVIKGRQAQYDRYVAASKS